MIGEPPLEVNVPQNVCHSAIKDDFLKFVRSTLCLMDLILKAEELLECMKQQGSDGGTTGTSLRKTILAHPESFGRFSISCQDLLNIFSEDKL